LTSGDGIYSRYLTNYPSSGRYEFSVLVDDNEKRAFFVKKQDFPPPSIIGTTLTRSKSLLLPTGLVHKCCGSAVFVPPILRQLTGEFSRRQSGPVLHLLSVPSTSLDLMPPSKVGDLRIKVLDDRKTLLAVWTAPGDDYDHGVVTGYKFILAENMSVLLNTPSEEGIDTLVKFERPDMAGIQTSYQFEFERYNQDCFFALIAFDERGNEAKMSNIVTIRIDSNDILAPSPGGGGSFSMEVAYPDRAPHEGGDEGGEGVMIGALCGAFGVIALLLWAGIWYHRNRMNGVKMTKNGGVTANLVKTGDNAAGCGDGDNSHLDRSSSSPMQMPLRAKMPQFSTLASGGAVYPGKSSLSAAANDKEDEEPSYWGASQLLQEHEQV
jgi:hypothetical protein